MMDFEINLGQAATTSGGMEVGDLNHNLLQTRDLQQNDGTRTGPQQKLADGHFEANGEAQNLAPIEQQ